MTLASVAIILGLTILAGVVMWLVNRFIPMAAPIKVLVNVVVVILVVILLLQAFGLWHRMGKVHLDRCSNPVTTEVWS